MRLNRYQPVVVAALLWAAWPAGFARAEAGIPYKHYRRGLSVANFEYDGTPFRLVKDKGLVGSVEAASPAGTKATLVRLEQRLPPGEYAVCLSVPEAVAMGRSKGKPASTAAPALDVPDAEPEETDELPLGEKKQPSTPGDPLPVRLRVSLGTNAGEITFPHGGEEPLHAVTIRCETAFNTLAIKLLSREKRIAIRGVYLTANPRDIALRRKTLGDAAPERDLFLDIHTLAIRQSERGILRTADSPEPPNHIYNGSFEAGCPSPWWCTPYQARVAITPELLVQSDCPDGATALVVPLLPHHYLQRAEELPDAEPETKEASAEQSPEDELAALEEPEPLVLPPAVGPAPKASYNVLPYSIKLCHRPLKLRPTNSYGFRAFLRPNAPASVTVSVETSYGELVKVGSATATLAPDVWTPVAFRFTTVEDNRGYDLTLAVRSRLPAEECRDGLTVALDAVQLSSTPPDATAFVPASPVEVGVAWDVPGKVFLASKGVSFRLSSRNAGTAEGQVRVRYRVYDYFNLLVTEGKVGDWVVGPGSASTRALPLDIQKTGAFRLLVDGTTTFSGTVSEIPLQEYAFSVLPEPPERPHGTFGVYSTLTSQPSAILGRTAIRRVVTLANMNSLLSQWACINPLPRHYVWADDLVANARANGITIVANLDIARGIPGHAVNPPEKGDAPPLARGARILDAGRQRRTRAKSLSRSAWSAFVEQTVRHYRADIQDWLIIDEPYYYMDMRAYAELFKLAAEAIRKADPDARVLIHGAYYPGNLATLEKLGCLDAADAIHDYDRDAGKGALLQAKARQHDLALHTVEYGGQRSIYQTIETTRPNWDTDFLMGLYRNNTASLAMKPVQRMAWARAATFSRNGAAYPGGEFLQFSGYKSMFEYDGALKPCGVAYAITASLLDGFRGAGQLNLNKSLEAYLMSADGRFCIAFRSKVGGKAARFDLPASLRCVDIMGNPVRAAPRRQWLGPEVCYLIGTDEALDEAKALLAGLGLADVYAVSARNELDEKSGQYLRNVTIRNLLTDESIEAWAGCRSAFISWERPRPLGRIKPGESASARFGLNAFRGEKRIPRGGEYVYVHALGGSRY